ncbi:outer membrane lipoprotein-sorting protein [Orenia metallireducens]|jgi:outer membrane lipoprotein-sorting protein|uniref:Outer membrane lipoprotein-sorting protein n=1 Tax=Orenia metallireducens TaxID=1413210 RepID=A0A1C0A978_9FIRM|nr:outer membrane lipoprotein-sorting protein [Orenia metallireducens]OCL26854.1 outer membrane lipoprotein-sorting protein [Orenia metallireducens]
MKRLIVVFICFIALIAAITTMVSAMTAEEIINRRDENEYIKVAKVEAEMVIINGRRKMSKNMLTFIEEDNSLTIFTNARDRGTKFLKRDDDLWMFFPEAEDIVKISGHMLNQGMMGSDFSYQDMMESDKLTDLYDFAIIGEEELNGRQCYVLEGVALDGKEVSYYRRKSWIDKERFIGLKEELYAKSERLLKVMNVKRVEQIDGRWYPVESVMENKLRKKTRTEFVIKSIKFNPKIPAGTFTLQNMQ